MLRFILILTILLMAQLGKSINMDSLILNTGIDSAGIDQLYKVYTRTLISDQNEALKILNYALGLSQDVNNKDGIIKFTYAKGVYFQYKNQYDSALYYYNKVEAAAIKKKLNIYLYRVYYAKGMAYNKLNKYNLSIEYYFKSIEISNEMDDKQRLFHPYMGVANIFIAQNNYTTALHYYLLALQYANGNTQKAIVYNNISIANIGLQQYGSALQYIDSVSKYSTQSYYSSEIFKISCLIKTGKLNQATILYNKIIKDSANVKFPKILMLTQAELLYAQKKYSQAITIVNKLSNQYLEFNISDLFLIKIISHIKVNSLLSLKSYEAAIKAMDYYSEIKEELYKKIYNLKTEEIETRYKIKLKDEKLKAKSNELFAADRKISDKDKFITVLIISILGLVILLIISIKYRINSNEEPSEAVSTLDREVVLNLLAITNFQKTIVKLNKKTNKLYKINENQAQSTESNTIIKQLLYLITVLKNDLKELMQYDENLQLADTIFYKKLLKINKTLTPLELKTCSLLKQNLTKAEISTINKQSIRTVEGVRYKIRKKLELKSTDNLISYLIDL